MVLERGREVGMNPGRQTRELWNQVCTLEVALGEEWSKLFVAGDPRAQSIAGDLVAASDIRHAFEVVLGMRPPSFELPSGRGIAFNVRREEVTQNG